MPGKTYAELKAHLATTEGKVSYDSGGAGGPQHPAMAPRMRRVGLGLWNRSPDEVAKAIRDDDARWKVVVKRRTSHFEQRQCRPRQTDGDKANSVSSTVVWWLW